MYGANEHAHTLAALWAKLFFLCGYPFLLAVILCLPTHPLSRLTLMRIVLDSLLIVTAVLTLSWYFLLGPLILHGPQPMWEKVIVALSLFDDLILLCCFLILASRVCAADVQPAKYLLLLGLACLLVGDGLGVYRVLQVGTTDGEPQEILWGISSLLFIIATYYMRLAQSPPLESQSKQDFSGEALIDLPPLWHALLPSACVPVVIVLVTYVWFVGHDDSLAQGVYLTGALLLAQVVVRQVFSLRETHTSALKLHLLQRELHVKNAVLGASQQRLEGQAQQIEQAYKQQRHLNELKDQFLLNVSHELRTPLTVLGGSLELLDVCREYLDPQRLAHTLKEALRSHEELVGLVNRVLESTMLGRELPAAKVEDVSLHQFLQGELAHLPIRDAAAYTIRLQVSEQLMVRADPQLLRQVLGNLLSNIFKYVPKQTEIRIEATQAAPSSPVCLWVQDAGPGIPAEELPLLFEKFVRLKRDLAGPTRGTGLGLSLCKQFVEAMGGRIWAESSGRPGEGSRFCVTLPPLHFPDTRNPPHTAVFAKRNSDRRNICAQPPDSVALPAL